MGCKKKKKREERSADEAFCVCHLPHPTLHIWDTEERKAPDAKLRRPRGVEMVPFERVVQAVTMLLCDGADPKLDIATGTDPRSDLGRPPALNIREVEFLSKSADMSSLLACPGRLPFVCPQTATIDPLLPTFFPYFSVFSNFHLLISARVIVASPHNFARRFLSFFFLISRLIFGLAHPNPFTATAANPTPPSFFPSVAVFSSNRSSRHLGRLVSSNVPR